MDKRVAASLIVDAKIPGVRVVTMSPSETRGRITVLSEEASQVARSAIMDRIEDVLSGESRRVGASSKSSIGHLDGQTWFVVVKPSKISSDGFSVVRRGAENEKNLLLAIKHVLHMYDEAITVSFHGGGSKYSVKDVRTSAAGTTGKGDVILTDLQGQEFSISVKQGESFKWDSGERRFETQFRRMLKDAINSKKFNLRPPEVQGQSWRITPAAVRQMSSSDQRLAVFGDRSGAGAVVIQRFSPSNFAFNGETGELSISVERVYSAVNQIPANLRPVFLIRNDESRNTYSGEFRGLRFEISPAKVGRKSIQI